MHNTRESAYDEEWVIWNGANGLLTTVTIGQIEEDTEGRSAWLEEPFDMVGPFSLEELITQGRIAFAACLVMSRQRWQKDQAQLQQESLKVRRTAEERVKERLERSSRRKNSHQVSQQPFNESQHREILKLPAKGNLEARQIKTAFRRLAQKMHPDVGGSKEQFVRIMEARNALLEYIS